MLSKPPRGRTLKSAARVQKIVSVLVKHGFQDVVERIKLLKPLSGSFTTSDVQRLSVAERLRTCCEELGPTFVKLGQVLATRPDLVPKEIAEEFERLHSDVQPITIEEVRTVVRQELNGEPEEVFAEFDITPLGSASIAQVHRAKLKTGESVVVKVQRPRIVETIRNDMSVLYFIAELLEKYVAEAKPFNPVGIVREFDRTLQLETNFIIEANNIRRFYKNFKKEPDIVIPRVDWQLTTERVLVMEDLNGPTLSSIGDDVEFDREKIVRRGLRAYFKMLFHDRLFHGDMHAGNFLILKNDRIGLVDFGVVGRLSDRVQGAITNMLIALAQEDYERLAFEYLDIAPYNEKTDPIKYARELSDLASPYFGLSLKNVNLGEILMSSAAISASNHVYLPSELTLYFKSVVAVEGLGRKIIPDFDFITMAMEFAGELVTERYNPQKLTKMSTAMARDTSVLLSDLPRQLRLMIRRVSAPGFAVSHKVERSEEMIRSIRTLSHLIFLSVVIGSLLIGSAIVIAANSAPFWLGVPVIGLGGLALSGVLSLVSVYQYLKR